MKITVVLPAGVFTPITPVATPLAKPVVALLTPAPETADATTTTASDDEILAAINAAEVK